MCGKPAFLQEVTDKQRVDLIINVELTEVMDYLESVAPSEGFIIGDFSIADISIGTQMLNAYYARYEVVTDKWPKLSSYIDRLFAHPVFRQRIEGETKMLDI